VSDSLGYPLPAVQARRRQGAWKQLIANAVQTAVRVNALVVTSSDRDRWKSGSNFRNEGKILLSMKLWYVGTLTVSGLLGATFRNLSILYLNDSNSRL
jgi:hypothetical protein